MNLSDFVVIPATEEHTKYAEEICIEMAESAKVRGTGIAQRKPEYVAQKMIEGKAVIALTRAEGKWAGFCYIETFSHGDYVANSGLIVNPEYRKSGLAKTIKKRIFSLSREKYPKAKIFGLTTGFAVMKINSDLGYKPVTFSELTDDENFWKGCQSCPNYDILMRTNKKNCLCTGMLYDPAWSEKQKKEEKNDFQKKKGIYERLLRIKRFIFFEQFRTNGNGKDGNKKKTKDQTFA